jgi:hypothetical protein
MVDNHAAACRQRPLGDLVGVTVRVLPVTEELAQRVAGLIVRLAAELPAVTAGIDLELKAQERVDRLGAHAPLSVRVRGAGDTGASLESSLVAPLMASARQSAQTRGQSRISAGRSCRACGFSGIGIAQSGSPMWEIWDADQTPSSSQESKRI